MPDAATMFKEAALIQLTATCWQTYKKLPESLLADVGNIDYLRGRKLLLSPESTALIREHVNRARNYLRKITLPFPLKGCQLIPRKIIPIVQIRLQEFKFAYNSAVEDFLYWYPQTVVDAKHSLGELYDDSDYPTIYALRSRFRFEWRYITIGPSNTKVLPPSIYKEEVDKFKNLMEQAREEAIQALRQEFVDLISNITDKLQGHDDGCPKRLRSAAVDNLKEFLAQFSSRNIFEDEELERLVDQCREIISDTSAGTIRTNSTVKQELHTQMSELLQAVDKQFENLPRRKLRFAA